jgi:signal peptidase I
MVALLLLAAGGWWLWPATLGGRTTYLVTQGVSMEPAFHSGDLALVRPASGYGVGDVVAYRSGTVHSVVMHRIVAVEDGLFRLRGDNNSWVDPDRVPPSDVVGRLVGQVPRGGDLLLQLREPYTLGVGGVLVALAGALLRLILRRRGRRAGHGLTSARSPSQQVDPGARRHPPPSHDAQRLLPHAMTVTASASVAFLSVGVLAWVMPASRVDSRAVAYTQRTALTYRASVPASPAYPTGELVTGDPVYPALVPALDVAASYRVTTSAGAALEGTRSVDAVLATQDGWTRTIPLVPPRPFRGDGFDVTAHLDLAEFARVIRDVEAATQVPIGGYTLTVRVDVHLSGAVAGQPVDQRVAPALAFTVNDHVVRLARSGTPDAGGAQAAGPSATGGSGSDGRAGRPQVTETAGSVQVPDRVPSAFTLRGHRVLTTELRWWPPAVGGVLVLVFLALAGRGRRQGRGDDEFARRLTQYQPHLLRTEQVPPVNGRTVIDLESIDALARVAERYERFILHSECGPEHNFVVDDGTSLYRFRTVAPHDPVPFPSDLPQQRSPWETTPDADPPAPPGDVGDQVTAFVERLRRSAAGQD